MTSGLDEVIGKVHVAREDLLRLAAAGKCAHPAYGLSIIDILAALLMSHLRFGQAATGQALDQLVLSRPEALPAVGVMLAARGDLSIAGLAELINQPEEFRRAISPHLAGLHVAAQESDSPLGIACGLAAAARLDHAGSRCYVLLEFGENHRETDWVAAAQAGRSGLDNLCTIVNYPFSANTALDTNPARPASLVAKWRAFGWHTLAIDGHDLHQLVMALATANATTGRPTAIVAVTKK